MEGNQLESARNVCHIFLGDIKRQRRVTSEDIRQVVANPLLKQQYPDIDTDELIAQLEADLEVWSGKATELVEQDVRPWLVDKKASIDWELWNRYRTWMKVKDGSFPIDNLDDLTDKILDKCINPKTEGSWDRRGMVVGNVQSGKTANYTGLINKATDAGYKLVIVIAGIHNTLRSQTQGRIDEGYIGRNSVDILNRRTAKRIGVGAYKVETEIFSYTSSAPGGDFKQTQATNLNVPIGGKSPTVLVIKKNKSILENLIVWLHREAVDTDNGPKIVNVPLLVIDDEADNASVNSGTELDVRTINRLIRTLLNLFSQNTFIGYTATPYANLFIPSTWSENLQTSVRDLQLNVGEDLFPRDFIVNIPPPSNYIGAAKVFGFENDQTGESHEGLDIIRAANDQEPNFPMRINKDNKDDLPDEVPDSLREAIKAFILSCAIRRVRGHESKHNSMLVHVAMRVAWIDRVAWLVNEIMRDYQRQIRSEQGDLLNELRDLFESDYQPTTTDVLQNLGYNDPKIKQHTWDEVKKELLNASSKIVVRAVHGKRNTRELEYHDIEEIDYKRYEEAGSALSVIAVGGNKLARGITLEGLSVSYYLRTTRMYDSLMQMGRWFGYRPGYVDLCRLYTTEQLVKWYRHVTMATEEMRADFDEMAAQNLRPADFQLKVRTHPGMLTITSLMKMREHEIIRVGFSGKTTQTFEFKKDENMLRNNLLQLEHLISRLGTPELRKTRVEQKVNGLIWPKADSAAVIDFIGHFQTQQPQIKPEILSSYIRKQIGKGNLLQWTVAVVLNSQSEVSIGAAEKKFRKPVQEFSFEWKEGGLQCGLPVRNQAGALSGNYLTLSRQNIFDPKDKALDLSTDKETMVAKSLRKQRSEEQKSLLVIYPLDWRVDSELPKGIPVVGWGLIFPEIQNEEKVEYAARPAQQDFEDELQENDDDAGEE